MAGIECEICLNYFDEKERRPKNLQCGHTFCLACMETSFAKGNPLCSLCRTPHNAETIDNIPFNFRLEELIRKKYKQSQSEIEEDEGFSHGNCLQHERNRNYFLCQTHNVYVCAECMLDEHKLGKCQLKSYKDELLERKEELKVIVDDNISSFETHVKGLKGKTCSKDKDIESATEEIERLQLLINSKKEEIKKDAEIREKYEHVLMEIQLKIKSFESDKEKIDNANKKRSILNVCDKINKEKHSLNDWLLSSIKNSKNLSVYLHMLESEDTMLKEGENKYSKVDLKNSYIHINALREDVRPTTENIILPHGIIFGLLPSNPTVFMTISASDVQIGTVYIKLTCPPQWMKQMVQLCTNLKGKTFKGTNFSSVSDKGAEGERIRCKQYVENGNSKSSTNFIPSLEERTCNAGRKRGDVQVCDEGPGFIIFTREGTFPDTNRVMLGHVISGIETVDTAIHKHTFESLNISEIGIALESIG
ncbi:unnamed protein product [Meganyctiphanes norvegica]|uniref:RING-type domain-containing protein n=1 Tax=Meganyctiphanes norvegica TaxID=48144 RepID=A0AAV2PSE8_MEGNR